MTIRVRFEMLKFRINTVFEITNRGYVLLGEILGGNIFAGAIINIDNIELRIQSIEPVRSVNMNEIGLMVGPIDGNVATKIKAFIGQTIII